MNADLVIVGGGPAGASAALFAARAGLITVVVDADKGITKRAMVHNHLGLANGVTGPELVEVGKQQALNAGATWVDGTATLIASDSSGVNVTLDSGEIIHATDAILALGVATALATESGIETKPATEPRISTVCVVDGEGRTTMPHVWAAGTIAGVSVHTIVTAGDGARVAINVVSERRGERYVDHDMLESPKH